MQYVNCRSFLNKIVNRAEINLKRTLMISRPLEITLEPTLKCNSDCIMCNRNFSREETKTEENLLSWETFRNVEPLFKYAEYVLFGGFGEALLHPEYLSMLREIKKSGPFVYFFTNGILMTENTGQALVNEGMDMVCVSMGGATKETYKKVRGVDAFERVVNNIRMIDEYKKKMKKEKPALAFNVVAMKSILPELQLLVKLAKEIGVELIRFPNLVVQGESLREESLWHDVEGTQKAFRDAAATARMLGVNFELPNFDICATDCLDIFKKMTINWDGSVMSCALERYIVGDLKDSNVNEIWNSKGLQKLRREYFEKGLKQVCPNCTNWDNRPETFLNPSRNSRKFATKI